MNSDKFRHPENSDRQYSETTELTVVDSVRFPIKFSTGNLMKLSVNYEKWEKMLAQDNGTCTTVQQVFHHD